MVSTGRLSAMGLLLIRAPAGRLAWSPASHLVRSTLHDRRTQIYHGHPQTTTGKLTCNPSLATRPSSTVAHKRFPTVFSGAVRHGHVKGSSRLLCASWSASFAPASIDNQRLAKVEDEREKSAGGVLTRGQEGVASTKPGDRMGDDEQIQRVLRDYVHVGSGNRVGKKRMKARQHVNPLCAGLQQRVEMPNGWFRRSFEKPAASLHVDIGCAKAKFVTSMAQAHPDRNFLGLEIRRAIAAAGLSQVLSLGLKNCFVVCGNANIDLDTLLTDASEQGAVIDTISIQFPDPYFKSKQQKRRVLQPELLKQIEKYLRPGGMFFMQSDFFPILEEMRALTREASELLVDSREDITDWLEGPENNPFGVPTEREVATLAKENPAENRVYRAVFFKKEQ